MFLRSARPIFFAFSLFSCSAAMAGVSAVELMSAGMPAECADFAADVSKSEGNWSSENKYGCVGAFQFCPGTFEAYYSGTKAQFKADHAGQVNAWLRYQRDEWAKAQRNGLTSAVGRQLCHNGLCATLTDSSILKACQFGCGSGGKLSNLVRNGYNCDARNVKDGNLKSVCDYLIEGAGYGTSCITGNTSGELCPPGTVPARTNDPT